MFKQQAKDLTNVSQLTSAIESMDQARTNLVQRLSSLRKLVALDESKLQVLQQRVARKEKSLAELSAAVSALELDHQTFAAVPESVNANIFRVLDETSATYSLTGDRLKPLLAAMDPLDDARFPTVDVLERDIMTHRMRCSLLDGLYQQLLEGSSVPPDLGPLLNEWRGEAEYHSLPLLSLYQGCQSTSSATPSWEPSTAGASYVAEPDHAIFFQSALRGGNGDSVVKELSSWLSVLERQHREASLAAGKLGLEGPEVIKSDVDGLRQLFAECATGAANLAALEQEAAASADAVVDWQQRFARIAKERMGLEDQINNFAQLPDDDDERDANDTDHRQATRSALERQSRLRGQWADEVERAAADDALVQRLEQEMSALLESHRHLDQQDADYQLELERVMQAEALAAQKAGQAEELESRGGDLLLQTDVQLRQAEAAELFTTNVMQMLGGSCIGPCGNHQPEEGDSGDENPNTALAKNIRALLLDTFPGILLDEPQQQQQGLAGNGFYPVNESDTLIAAIQRTKSSVEQETADAVARSKESERQLATIQSFISGETTFYEVQWAVGKDEEDAEEVAGEPVGHHGGMASRLA
jgi:hypothetical protein